MIKCNYFQNWNKKIEILRIKAKRLCEANNFTEKIIMRRSYLLLKSFAQKSIDNEKKYQKFLFKRRVIQMLQM